MANQRDRRDRLQRFRMGTALHGATTDIANAAPFWVQQILNHLAVRAVDLCNVIGGDIAA
jgi:hypothetical protein